MSGGQSRFKNDGPLPPRINGAVDGVGLAFATDGAQRLVHCIEREGVGAHFLERIFAAGDDLQSELDRLIAVTAHALDREEAREQDVDVELRHWRALAPADENPSAFARKL